MLCANLTKTESGYSAEGSAALPRDVMTCFPPTPEHTPKCETSMRKLTQRCTSTPRTTPSSIRAPLARGRPRAGRELGGGARQHCQQHGRKRAELRGRQALPRERACGWTRQKLRERWCTCPSRAGGPECRKVNDFTNKTSLPHVQQTGAGHRCGLARAGTNTGTQKRSNPLRALSTQGSHTVVPSRGRDYTVSTAEKGDRGCVCSLGPTRGVRARKRALHGDRG